MQTNTLSDFLDASQCQFRVYELGRKVTKISNSEFRKIDANKAPYPYPIQKQAFFAIVFWQTQQQGKDHFIWFLKMPIDEQGFLKITAQTSFIKMVIEAMGDDLTSDMSKKLQERLASNPYVFKPSTEKLAVFNSKINAAFIRPASTFYPAAQHYFSGNADWNDWKNLGFQGIADIASRLDRDNNQAHLINAIPKLPEDALRSLAVCLEHSTDINPKLTMLIAMQAATELGKGNEALAILLLRAISSSPSTGITKSLIEQQLSSDLVYDPHWYISVAGRVWQQLEDETLLNKFLEALANHQSDLFSDLFSDLVAIPSLRDKVLKQLRQPVRSPALSNAIGQLFSNVKSSASC